MASQIGTCRPTGLLPEREKLLPPLEVFAPWRIPLFECRRLALRLRAIAVAARVCPGSERQRSIVSRFRFGAVPIAAGISAFRALVCALVLLGLTACGGSHRLKYYGQVPNFELTSQTGQKIALADLKGKVWVADTIYTTCTGPCPMMSAHMRTVAGDVAALANVRIVSITVDPAHDTPDALLTYAHRFHSAPDRWFFLTGPQSVLNHLAMDGLHLAPVDGTLDHSTKFVLVDSDARIRGYYLPSYRDEMERLVADVRSLAGS